MSNATIPDFSGFIWFLLVAVFGGFVFLFWRIIQGLMADTSGLRDEIRLLRQEIGEAREGFKIFPLIYRTKEEASADWKALNRLLAEIQSDIRNLAKQQTDGVRQLWDKLNRTVESFFFLAKMIVDRQQAFEDKLYCDDKDALTRAHRDTAELLAQLEKVRLERLADANHT